MSFDQIVTRLAWIAHRLAANNHQYCSYKTYRIEYTFKERDQIGLRCLLESEDSRGLEAEGRANGTNIYSSFTNKTLEGKLQDQKADLLLIVPNFKKSPHYILINNVITKEQGILTSSLRWACFYKGTLQYSFVILLAQVSILKGSLRLIIFSYLDLLLYTRRIKITSLSTYFY